MGCREGRGNRKLFLMEVASDSVVGGCPFRCVVRRESHRATISEAQV